MPKTTKCSVTQAAKTLYIVPDFKNSMFVYTAFSHFDQLDLARGNHCEATHQEMGHVFQASQTMTIERATKLELDA